MKNPSDRYLYLSTAVNTLHNPGPHQVCVPLGCSRKERSSSRTNSQAMRPEEFRPLFAQAYHGVAKCGVFERAASH